MPVARQRSSIRLPFSVTWFRRDWKKQFKNYDNHWQHAYLSWNLSPPVDIDIAGRPARGPENARHTLVVFSDFQCSWCRQYEDYVRKTIVPSGKKKGGLKVVFKHWPICTDCNEFASRNSHPMACKASLAAEAARLLGGDEAFWKMHDLLWEHQARWAKSGSFAELAREIGLHEKEFLAAMDSEEAIRQVKADIAEGANLGKGQLKEKTQEFVKVNSTPSVFIDNKRVWRMHKKKELWSMILTAPPRGPRPR